MPWTLDHQEIRDKTNGAQEELARTLSIHVARKEVGDWGVFELQRAMNAFQVHFLFPNNAYDVAELFDRYDFDKDVVRTFSDDLGRTLERRRIDLHREAFSTFGTPRS